MSDFDENFFDGFDEDVDQVLLDDEDLLDDIIDDDEEEGINRTFLIAGLGLVGVFLASIIGIVLLSSGGGDSGADETAQAIATTNEAALIAFANTGTADTAATLTAEAAILTAEAEASQTAFANQTETIDAYETLLDQTRLANERNATATELAIRAFATNQALSLTPPTSTPTATPAPISVEGEIDPAGPLTIVIIRDDNNDGIVTRPATQAPPTPTIQPTLTPQSTPTASSTPTELVIPEDLPEADAALTIEAATQSAELENQRATVNAAATFRAGTATADAQVVPTLEPTEVSEVPDPTDTGTDGATDGDIDVDEEPDLSETLIQTFVGATDRVSVQVPADWLSNDQIETLGILYIGNSIEAIETRAAVEGETLPPVVGVGGQIIPQTLADTGGEAVTPELLAELLAGSLEAAPDIDIELATIEGPTAITFDNGVIGHYIILSSGNEQSILAYLGFAEDVALVNLSSTVEEFDANRDLLFAILETISVPAEIGVAPIEDAEGADVAPVEPEETEEFDADAQGSVPNLPNNNPLDNGVMFFRSDQNSGNSGVHQDGGTPTPEGGDTIEFEGTFNSGERIVLNLPSGPGTYYVVTDLNPGDYTLTLDGQTFTFSMPEIGEGDPIFIDVPLEEIGNEGQTFILRVFARVGEGDVPTPDPNVGSLSPFLQTATAVGGAGPVVTATDTPESLPTAGGALDSGGLTLLAILGVGLIGVVFVVRRLRSETYA